MSLFSNIVVLNDAQINGNASCTDLSVTGDFTVTGTTTTLNTEELLIESNFLATSANYTSTTGLQSGICTTVKATATGTTSTNGGFATLTTIKVTSTGNFPDDSFIQISGAANSDNNGVYVVDSVTIDTITIKNSVTAGAEFMKLAFVVDATDTTANVTPITLTCLRSNGSGVWEALTATALDSSMVYTSVANPAPVVVAQLTATDTSDQIVLDSNGVHPLTISAAPQTVASTIITIPDLEGNASILATVPLAMTSGALVVWNDTTNQFIEATDQEVTVAKLSANIMSNPFTEFTGPGSHAIGATTYNSISNPMGTSEVTLPSGVNGDTYIIVSLDAFGSGNDITITTNVGGTINGGVEGSSILPAGLSVKLVNRNGTDWYSEGLAPSIA